jgi:signal transduction histidine kinase
MRWGIRNQILWPFAVVLLVAVALTAAAAAWMAVQRSERELADRQSRVLRTLGRSNFPWTQNVLEMMRGLSGAEFMVWDGGVEGGKRKAEGGNPTIPTVAQPSALNSQLSRKDEPAASTLPPSLKLDPAIRRQIRFDEAASFGPDAGSVGHVPLTDRNLVQIGDRRYFAAGLRRVSPRGVEQSLVALYPEEQLLTARREAALPPLIVGGLTLVAMAIVAAWLASRIGRRIRTVQQQVALIAGGEFREMPSGTTRDEIFALVQSINQMAAKLRGFQETIERTERTRLLGQLAGGLAHQLRNAVTGARLAIQLHQRRSERRTQGFDKSLGSGGAADRDSLDIALRQLEITEEHIKGLLSVGRPERREPQPRPLADVLDDVAALVSPVCRHENIAFSRPSRTLQASGTVSDSEAVRTAVLNLVLNAVDAAGPNGEITVRANTDARSATIDVLDNGPGPPAELRERLFEPFVTGKPEGVGLGLALVKQVADDLGGSVAWERSGGRTAFRFTIPVESGEPGASATGADRTDSESLVAHSGC